MKTTPSYPTAAARVPQAFILRGTRWVAVALLALGAIPTASALSFEEAVAMLASEEFAEREKGEKFLSSLGLETIPRLKALVQAPDPEVAFRSRRALLCVRLGLEPTVPPGLVRKITALGELSPDEIRATVDQLLAIKPGLLTLAGLHTELINKTPAFVRLNPDWFEQFSDAFRDAAAAPSPVDISQIDAQSYCNQTLSILAAGFSQRHADNLAPLVKAYSSWVNNRPQLPALLTEAAVPLELARIQARASSDPPSPADIKKQVVEIVAFANLSPKGSRQQKLILAGADILRDGTHSPIDALDLREGLALLTALQDNWTQQMDASLYERFRQRFPDATPPKGSTLEVTYLLEKDGVNAALALALSQPQPHGAIWLGSWLQLNPDKIPNPLVIPTFSKEKPVDLRPFINALVPLRSVAEMQANPAAMAASEVLLRDAAWLTAALKADVTLPFFCHWIRAGTLDTAIPKHLTGSTDRLRALGRVLVTTPASLATINPAQQNPLDLQRILLGMLEQPLPRPVAKVVFAQADEWLKLYPDMWQTNGFRFDIPRAEFLAPNDTEALANLLSLAPKHAAGFAQDDPAYAALLRSLKRYTQEAQTFPTTNLTSAEGSLFFNTFAATPETAKLFAERYEAFRKQQAEAANRRRGGDKP